ncbi:MAG: SulP family inorganic anion transporter, partial [Planctomycetota bacterium]
MGWTRTAKHTCWIGCRFAAGPVLSAGSSLGRSVRTYNARKLRGDLIAGLTVAMVAIPQSMAFAAIAGVPPIYGLYTAVVGTIVGSLLTSSPHLALGPTNTMSLLVSSGLVALAVTDGNLIETAVMLTLFAGVIQIAFALARMGELVRYVSHSVIVGFSAGAGVLIAVGPVPAWVGISVGSSGGGSPGFGGRWGRVIRAGGRRRA